MTDDRRAFTVDEANALLPLVRQTLEEIEARRERASEHHEKLQVLDALWGEAVRRRGNPDHPEYLRRRQAIDENVREVERLIRDEILGRGIRFPAGGLEHGLVDFPTTLDGRWVYLCWRYGEPEVGFWHEVDGGYRGRREIAFKERLRMGRDGEIPDDSALDF